VVDIEADKGPYGPRFTWWLEADLPTGTQKLRSWTSRDLDPRSRAATYFTAILGRVPKPGEVVMDEVIGKECTVEVQPNERGFLVVKAILPRRHDFEADEILY
jgi:hypothetical protein